MFVFNRYHQRHCISGKVFVLIQHLPVLQDQYDPVFEKQVQASQVVTINDVKGDRLAKGGNYRLIYHTKDNFKKFAKSLGLMDDFKVRGNPKCYVSGKPHKCCDICEACM